MVLGANHFGERWDAMGVGNEAVAVGSTKLPMDPASCNSVHGRLRTIKLGLGLGALDESGEGLFCAAAIHAKTRQKGAQDRVLLGLMAKVLVKGKELKVTVRAPTEKAAALLAECMVHRYPALRQPVNARARSGDFGLLQGVAPKARK